MEHLHHQRGRCVLLLIAFATTTAIACGGDGSTGDGSFPVQPREANGGGDPLGGIDLGGANDPGSGVDQGSPPPSCRSNADCRGGICTGDAIAAGVCLNVCGLSSGLAAPGVTIVRCVGAEECIEISTTFAVCLIPCTSGADCPDLGSNEVHDVCQAFAPGRSFCVGESVSKPSG